MWTLTVAMKPAGKGRPRFANGRVHTPRATERAENIIRAAALAKGGTMFTCPLRVSVHACFAMPARWSRPKRAEMTGQPHAQKPDGDNIAKLVGDALNGIVWKDDSQIADWRVRKVWGDTNSLIIMASSEMEW